YLTMCLGVAMLIATIGIVAGGRINFEFFPTVEGDVIVAEVEMPYGTSIERTAAVQERLIATASELIDEKGKHLLRGMYSNIGAAGLMRGDPNRPPTAGTHLAEVALYLVPPDQRAVGTEEFA